MCTSKSGWWFGCHQFYFPRNSGLISSSQLTNSYFLQRGGRQVAHAPTRNLCPVWVRVWETAFAIHDFWSGATKRLAMEEKKDAARAKLRGCGRPCGSTNGCFHGITLNVHKNMGKSSFLMGKSIINDHFWLVVWNINFIFPYIGNNHPNWLIFFRGVQTTNQISIAMLVYQRVFHDIQPTSFRNEFIPFIAVGPGPYL